MNLGPLFIQILDIAYQLPLGKSNEGGKLNELPLLEIETGHFNVFNLLCINQI